jgi:hypothetical protein
MPDRILPEILRPETAKYINGILGNQKSILSEGGEKRLAILEENKQIEKQAAPITKAITNLQTETVKNFQNLQNGVVGEVANLGISGMDNSNKLLHKIDKLDKLARDQLSLTVKYGTVTENQENLMANQLDELQNIALNTDSQIDRSQIINSLTEIINELKSLNKKGTITQGQSSTDYLEKISDSNLDQVVNKGLDNLIDNAHQAHRYGRIEEKHAKENEEEVENFRKLYQTLPDPAQKRKLFNEFSKTMLRKTQEYEEETLRQYQLEEALETDPLFAAEEAEAEEISKFVKSPKNFYQSIIETFSPAKQKGKIEPKQEALAQGFFAPVLEFINEENSNDNKLAQIDLKPAGPSKSNNTYYIGDPTHPGTLIIPKNDGEELYFKAPNGNVTKYPATKGLVQMLTVSSHNLDYLKTFQSAQTIRDMINFSQIMDDLNISPGAKAAVKYRKWYVPIDQRKAIEDTLASTSQAKGKGKAQEGHGHKKKRVNKIGKGVTFYECSNPNRLKKRLTILIGSKEAGNVSKNLRNEAYAILDELLRTKNISKTEHKKLFEVLSN